MRLFRSGMIVALGTLTSRIFGLMRELFVASIFGTSAAADSVNVAFKLPNLFRRLFGEGALSIAFIPIFNQKLLESKEHARAFSSEVFTLLLIVITTLVVLMEIFMPSLMFVIAPGFYEDPEKLKLTIILCRITMPYLLFIALVAMFGGMLNSIGRFAAFSFVPSVVSISTIIFTLSLQGYTTPPISISISLLIAGVFQIALMLIAIIKADLAVSIAVPKDQDVMRFIKNIGPAMLASSVQALNIFISQSIASFIPGAVSILTYADRVYQFPLSMIGITFGTILLPELSKVYKNKDLRAAEEIQNNAIKIGLLLSIPAAIGIIVLSKPIIHIIYERGVFSSEDTIKTAAAIAGYGIGLPSFVISKILTPIFYANNDTKTPLRISIYSLTANILLNIALMVPFKHVGIAIGTSTASWYNVWLLYRYSKQYSNVSTSKETVLYCIKILLGSAIMVGALLIITHYYGTYFYNESELVKVASLSFAVLTAAIVFIATSLLLGLHKLYITKGIKNS